MGGESDPECCQQRQVFERPHHCPICGRDLEGGTMSRAVETPSARQKAPPFPPDYRASGLLLHVTSLPSAYGIGDLGPAAFAWIDRLHDAGQRWWQALPLGPTGDGDSPYQPLSSLDRKSTRLNSSHLGIS